MGTHARPAAAAIGAARSHAASTHFGPGQAFEATRTITDRDGSTHVRMRRTYRGLDVVGGDLVVHQSRTGAWLGRSQTLRQDLRLSTVPTIEIAKGELVVDAHEGAPRLAWRTVKTGVQDDGTPSRVEVYTDARTSSGPLTSLDVAGHETSHGVTENSANLAYSGESGGLNEATSDIFGTMVEFYAANENDAGDYLIGEEFDLGNHLGFRRMDDPVKDGASQSCWTTGTRNLDVHYSSGVGNHFCYLLAEGSGAKTIGGVAHNSPTCNGATISGIGRDAAAEIWYRALTVYMTSSTDYRGARTASLNAAWDLFGAGSTQYDTVSAAWSAVNVA